MPFFQYFLRPESVRSFSASAVVDGKKELHWVTDPMVFLNDNFDKIVDDYMGNLSLCDYDPQKVGKAPKVYDDASKTYKMAHAGIL